jgi:hypothetical protein
VGVEERERPGAVEGLKPQCDLRDFDGEVVEVDAVDAAAKSTSGPATPTTRSGYANDHPVPQRTPWLFRKLDAVAVLTGPLLPAP